jgi:pimeloyl-ACP methyl ester carboxylesterase
MSMSPTTSLIPRERVATALGQVAYLEAGEGPTALFVHGVFFNGELWRAQLDALSDVRRRIAIDLLAHGASDCAAPGPFDLSTQADMIIAFLDAMQLDEVDLIGNDSGGAIVQLVAVRITERIATMTLTNCDTHDNWPPPMFQPIVELARAGGLAPSLPAIVADPALARASVVEGFEDPDALSDEFLLALFSPFADPARAASLETYVASMDCAVTVAIRDQLAELQVPTLIVWANADAFFDTSWATWLSDTLPLAELPIEVEGAKLFFPLERPEALNRELRAWWSRMPR